MDGADFDEEFYGEEGSQLFSAYEVNDGLTQTIW
jgi:hypothetical protein